MDSSRRSKMKELDYIINLLELRLHSLEHSYSTRSLINNLFIFRLWSRWSWSTARVHDDCANIIYIVVFIDVYSSWRWLGVVFVAHMDSAYTRVAHRWMAVADYERHWNQLPVCRFFGVRRSHTITLRSSYSSRMNAFHLPHTHK